jgi:TonB family protein
LSVILHVASTTIAILFQLVYPASVRARFFATEVEVAKPNRVYMAVATVNVPPDRRKVSVRPTTDAVPTPAHDDTTLTKIPDATLTPIPTEIEAPAENDAPGMQGFTMVSAIPALEPSVFDVHPPEPVPEPEPPASSSSAPDKPVVKIGGRVVQAEIIRKVSPVYPEAARRAGVQGAVVLNAVVNKQGILEEIQIVSGHPLLIKAALDCVHKWRYRPGTLNENVIDMPVVIRVQFVLNYR